MVDDVYGQALCVCFFCEIFVVGVLCCIVYSIVLYCIRGGSISVMYIKGICIYGNAHRQR